VTLSPLRYHYQHRAEVEAVVQAGTGRDVSFDALAAAVGIILSADRTLGGLCDWVEAQAPRPVDLAIDGAASLKAGVIHFTTRAPTHWSEQGSGAHSIADAAVPPDGDAAPAADHQV
jgi:hypothetical protein